MKPFLLHISQVGMLHVHFPEYGYITNTSDLGGGYGPGAVNYSPYTRIFKRDDNKFDYKPAPNIITFNQFMPLDVNNPIPGIEKCYKLMMLEYVTTLTTVTNLMT